MTNECLGSEGFAGEYYISFKEELIITNKTKEAFPNLFYEVSISLITKSDKDYFSEM